MSFEKKLTASLVLLLSLCALTVAQTPIRECSNSAPVPLMVQFAECYQLPCDLPMGMDTHISVQFVATKNTMFHVSSTVGLSVLGTQLPIQLTENQSNVCKNLLFGAYCPLYAGEDVTYHLTVPMGDKLPEVPSKLEVNILDDSDGAVVACFVADVRLKRTKKV